ncbi:flagellin FliC [bacterium]|nr:flagellin FliC [bacterium]
MSVVVNTNIQSLIGQNSLNRNTTALGRTLEQLSSGLKINSAKDDAAGLGVAELMTAQIKGNAQALSNIQDGMNLIQTAEGGLSIILENVQRIRELSIQAANEVYDENSRQAILNEIGQRLKTINQISATTNFNGKSLIDGSINTLFIQVGPNGDLPNADPLLNSLDIAPSLTDARTDKLGIDLKITALGKAGGNAIDANNWSTQDVRNYINKLDDAITKITNDMSVMGAYMNAMESSSDNLTTMNLSLESARSEIRDVDIAQASSDMIRYQILQQTSTSVLAQANQMPTIALSLLSA